MNKQLHDKYGPIVRIGTLTSLNRSKMDSVISVWQGPSELSAIDINIALGMLGPGGLPKGRCTCFYNCCLSTPTVLVL